MSDSNLQLCSRTTKKIWESLIQKCHFIRMCTKVRSRIKAFPSNTQSIIPFLCNSDASADVHNQSLQHKEVRATCPTCYLDLPIREIEAHTDVCAEQIGPVGTVNMELESEMPDDQDEIVSEQVATIGDGSVQVGKK